MLSGIRSRSGRSLLCLPWAALSSVPPSASGTVEASGPALPPYSGAIENCRSPGAYTAVKSRLPPSKRLDPVPPPPAEQKQRPLKRVHLELALYQVCQPVNAASQICVSAGDVHRTAAVEIVQHMCSISTNIFSCSLPHDG